MHLSDGVLPTAVAVGSFVASGLCVAVSLKKTDPDNLPKIAVMTSAFFVASLIHVPLGPTSVHLLLPGLVGILTGWSAFLSIFLGLVLQSLLFQFGGLTALGANGLMMGLPAWCAAWLYRRASGRQGKGMPVVAALASGTAVALAALILAALLATGGEDFFGVAKIAILAHVPVLVVEGVVSAFVVGFLQKVKPELLWAPMERRGA
ncbi:cobalt transporter CbiM [Desulfosoma caldarium]|uniref:Cobalt/nickel transport system permease protein n=1 Tax=Desulfosoma caldarium TaxID=610254 RepID=A0A3N1UM89_9BACT|nr:cobalt transporter CbiM [Desulfosoma caldarium]ROQ92324.1 cobalt/nickel transport system permease protein [Desulfosoma caldarium]